MRVLLLILFLILFIFYIPHSVFASTIKLNEFYAAGGNTSSNPDWVEIYYSGVDITLYQLRDAAGNTKNLSEGSYGGNFATVDWSNRLNNNGDTIKLALIITPDSPIDQVIYGGSGDISAPSSGQSAGRNPDGTGNWTILSTPSKGSTNNTSPTSTPTPISIPSQSPSPTPTPSSTSQATSSFTISNIPTQINSDQSFSVTVNLSQTDNPNTKFFLKGAFRHRDKPTNYFGLTKVGSTWVKNGMTATSQLQITTDQNGNWTDKIEVQPDSLDSGFIGTDDYFLKVARYDQDGENLTWSNETTIKINNVTTPSNNPSPQPTLKTSPSASLTKLQSLAPKPIPSLKSSYQIASVAGAQTATPEGKIEIQNQKQTNPIVWVGLIFIFAGVSALGYIYLKKNAKIHIPFGR